MWRMLRLSLTVACIFSCFSISLRASEPALKLNPDGTYSVPASALTDAARRNLIGGFTYDLPTGWSLKTVPGAVYKMAFGREQDGNPANISAQEIDFNGTLGQLESKIIKEAPASLAAQGLTGFRVLNQSAFETGSNVIGLQVVTETQRQDRRIVRQLYYFFERRDGKKIVVICSVADEGAAYDAEFNAIMRRFRVTK